MLIWDFFLNFLTNKSSFFVSWWFFCIIYPRRRGCCSDYSSKFKFHCSLCFLVLHLVPMTRWNFPVYFNRCKCCCVSCVNASITTWVGFFIVIMLQCVSVYIVTASKLQIIWSMSNRNNILHAVINLEVFPLSLRLIMALTVLVFQSLQLFHFDVHEDVRTIADATIEKDEVYFLSSYLFYRNLKIWIF